MDPISIALGLAQFAPTLLRYLGVGEKTATVAEKAIDIARTVTGLPSGADALEELKTNPELQVQFRAKIMENETHLEELYLADVADARKRDTAFLTAGTRNYRADFMVGISYALVIFIVYKVWTIPEMNEFAKATITLILGRLLGYIDQAFQFEFGTTKSSKTKDASIENLVRKM